MAFVLGLGFVLAMSSFVRSELNTAQSTKTYYHYAVTNDFTTTVPDPESLSCQSDDVYCRVTYTGPSGSLPAASSFAEGSIPAPASGVTRTLIDQSKGYKPNP